MKKLLENWRNYQTLAEGNQSDSLGKSHHRFSAQVAQIKRNKPHVDAEAYVIKKIARDPQVRTPENEEYLKDVIYAVRTPSWQNDVGSFKKSIIDKFGTFTETGKIPDITHTAWLHDIRLDDPLKEGNLK